MKLIRYVSPNCKGRVFYCPPVYSGIARDLLSALDNAREVSTSRRRKILLLEIGDRTLHLKKYLRSFAQYRVKREFHNLVKLNSFSISVPREVGYIKDKDGSLLVTEYKEGVRTVKELLETVRDFAYRKRLIFELGNLIKTFVEKGVYPADFHTGNIIYDGNKAYLVDVNRIITSQSPEHKWKFLANVLFSVYSLMTSTELFKLFEKFRITPEGMEKIHRQYIKRLHGYVRDRSWRALSGGNSDYEVVEGILREKKSAVSFRKVLRRIPSVPAIKKTSSATCYCFDGLFVKSFTSPRKALQCARNHLFARYARLNCADLYCYGNGIVVSRLLGNTLTLTDYVRKQYSKFDRSNRNKFLVRLASMFKEMYYKGFYHRDMKANNILVDLAAQNFYITDLEDLKMYVRGVKKDSIYKNLSQLNASVPRAVSRGDRLRFLRHVSNFLLLDVDYDRETIFHIMKETVSRRHVWP